MASGDTLCTFVPYQNEPPSSNYATLGLRNFHPVLQFDDTTPESAVFTAVMPQNYSNAIGVTVFVIGTAVATSGTVGWTVEFERLDSSTDLDVDSFAPAQTIAAGSVPAASGQPLTLSVAVVKGATMASIVAGDLFRIRVKRDVVNDTAVGDSELLGVEIRES